ncbi:hypothetical protein C8R44DRAFT_871737 [Mycena epipterygia]|nr:hypothetical protein C8R44DRAFT_871737 [Mycena epipterygia]
MLSNTIDLSLDFSTTLDPTFTEAFRRPCEALNDILSILTLPRLRDLTCKAAKYPDRHLAWPHAQLLALATRSSFYTHLETLLADHILPYYHLISDTLLAQLTRQPSPAPFLVPYLRALHLRSLLQFDDNVYLHFVLSRLHDIHALESRIRSLPGHHRDLDPGVVVELRAQKKLVFSFAAMGTKP